jgi:hypothetical protein
MLMQARWLLRGGSSLSQMGATTNDTFGLQKVATAELSGVNGHQIDLAHPYVRRSNPVGVHQDEVRLTLTTRPWGSK